MPDEGTDHGDRRFKILCISGGGYLGLYSAEILQALETSGQQRRSVTPDVAVLHEQFDLICGTSVGGLIGLGIAYGVPAHTIAKALREHGPRIFPKGLGWNPVTWVTTPYRTVRSYVSPTYGAKPLEDALEDVLGGDPKLSAVKTRALVVAVSLADGKPAVFRATPGTVTHKHKDGAELTAKQILLATAAAPTYFSAKEIDGALYADGGLVANAPDMVGYVEAMRLGKPAEDVHILAIGTTAELVGMPHAKGGGFGKVAWLRKKRILRLAMNAQMTLAQQQLRDLMGGAHAGTRYEIIDIHQGPEAAKRVGLDRATKAATAEIQAMVAATLQWADFKAIARRWINR